MKFNDKEITVKGNEVPDIEGILHYLRPQNNDWSTWYSAPSFKERKFKLIANLLFYYRLGENEPLGVIVLENVNVKHERPLNGVFFPFSLEFTDEQQHKYIFSCRCQEEANSWVFKLKSASYEYWRTQLVILQKKINMRTGKDLITICAGNQARAENLLWCKDSKIVAFKSSFQCHVSEGVPINSTTENALHNKDTNSKIKKSEPPTDDLIKF